MSAEVELFPGDTVQVEGGPCIVEAVGAKTADLLPLAGGRPRQHANTIAKHLVLKRGGRPALDKFLGKTQPKDPPVNNDMVRLEPGDQLCHGGELRTVVAVTDKTATLMSPAGAAFQEKRSLNRIYFNDCRTRDYVRLDPAQRAAHLKDFLAALPPAARVENETQGGDKDGVMPKKTPKKIAVAKKQKQAKTPEAGSAELSRRDYIWSQLDGSKTKAEIVEAVVAKFGGDAETVAKRVNDAPFYMRKAGLSPAWKKSAELESEAK